jgi:hypothetical protein
VVLPGGVRGARAWRGDLHLRLRGPARAAAGRQPPARRLGIARPCQRRRRLSRGPAVRGQRGGGVRQAPPLAGRALRGDRDRGPGQQHRRERQVRHAGAGVGGRASAARPAGGQAVLHAPLRRHLPAVASTGRDHLLPASGPDARFRRGHTAGLRRPPGGRAGAAGALPAARLHRPRAAARAAAGDPSRRGGPPAARYRRRGTHTPRWWRRRGAGPARARPAR